MKKVTFAALAALTITACSSGPKFQVNGDVSGADGKMLYLEASGLEGIVPLDSVKLKGEGTFSFKQPRPESPKSKLRMWISLLLIRWKVRKTAIR